MFTDILWYDLGANVGSVFHSTRKEVFAVKGKTSSNRTKKPFGAGVMQKVPLAKGAALTRTIQHTGTATGQDSITDTD